MESEDEISEARDIGEHEFPDESDMDTPGEQELVDTIVCPYCRRTIYDQTERCPHCGEFISQEEKSSSPRKPMWILLTLILCMITFLFLSFFLQN